MAGSPDGAEARLAGLLAHGGVVAAARGLLGARLVRTNGGEVVVARIVETEAYGATDPASHARNGPTARNRSMFAHSGTAYVYRIYGVHHCVNVAVGPPGDGAAVLLRAARVEEGESVVRRRRGAVSDAALLRGPGCLTRGLDIDVERHDGVDLFSGGGLSLVAPAKDVHEAARVRAGPRVGVSRAPERPWRFWLAGEDAVSRYRAARRVRLDGGTQERRGGA